jgi:tetratricopeptide (TPR) repeat protein
MGDSKGKHMDESEKIAEAVRAVESAGTLLKSGSHEQALALFAHAEDVFREAGDGHRQARACANKALVLAGLRRFEEALVAFRSALKGFEREGEFIHVAGQWGNIGSVHRDMEQPDDALRSYEESLAIYRELGLKEPEADQCTNIAYALVMKGELANALSWCHEALSLYTDAGCEGKSGLVADNIARLESALGKETK